MHRQRPGAIKDVNGIGPVQARRYGSERMLNVHETTPAYERRTLTLQLAVSDTERMFQTFQTPQAVGRTTDGSSGHNAEAGAVGGELHYY